MIWLAQSFLLLLLVMVQPSSLIAQADAPPVVWNFDSVSSGSLPPDFVIGTLFDGRPAGEWKVLRTEQARSGEQVLAQTMGKGAEHAYKVVLSHGPVVSDLILQVSFLPIAGKADMGGG